MDEFWMADHLEVIREIKTELWQRNLAKNDPALASIATKLSFDNHMIIMRGKETGQWLSVLPLQVKGNALWAQAFQDTLLICYARSHSDLPSHCDTLLSAKKVALFLCALCELDVWPVIVVKLVVVARSHVLMSTVVIVLLFSQFLARFLKDTEYLIIHLGLVL
jgi:hypothetical protein